MALVSAGGMGEAVLGFGDGIASGAVNEEQDGGVFAGQSGEVVLARGIRFECENNDATRKGRVMEHSSALPEGALIEKCQALFARPPILVKGTTDSVVNDRLANGSLGSETIENGADANVNCSMEAGIVNGGSHVPNGCGDHLVEMAIQCLDEKVHVQKCIYVRVMYCPILDYQVSVYQIT